MKKALSAYTLLFIFAPIGGGVHRIYCGNIKSGLVQIVLFWGGKFIALISGAIFILFIWALWWIMDLIILVDMVEDANEQSKFQNQLIEVKNLKAINELYFEYK
ncbi:MAG: hypothetical protein GXZ15_02910, partial [Campylobacter sp.]|nr:hypothetical protein [Campylobacter sp.]